MEKREYFGLVIALSLVILLAFLVSASPDWTVSGTNVLGSEDILFTYNFTNNASNSSWNEGLTFSILNITAVNYTNNTLPGNYIENYSWVSLASSTGILSINATSDNQTALFTMFVAVSNSSGSGDIEPFYFNISPVNDVPVWNNLLNKTFNMTEVFSWEANVTDEENNVPFKLNITFMSCDVAQWSTRNCSTDEGKSLFNSTAGPHYTFNNQTGVLNITFTPQRNDVGSYLINFTVTDSGSTSSPHNATSSKIVNYTVLVLNSKPYFTYVCEDNREGTEDTPFSCYVNATDIDEVSNLTVRSNASGTFNSNRTSWFTFNSTISTHILSVDVNSTTLFNASWLVNFTPSDYNVGNWSVNMTINDTGIPVQSNSTTFYFFVANTADNVFLDEMPALTAYTSNNYTLYLNATDDDLLIPDKTVYNEILTFRTNNSNLTLATFSNSSNKTTSRITFNPNHLGIGEHMVLINVTDASGNTDFTLFNITVVNNTPPVWNESTLVDFTLIEGTNFYLNLSQNVSDAENDDLTFVYSNDTAFQNFALTSLGIIDFTPTDFDVGLHVLLINVTDGITPASLNFTLEVLNLNGSDAPRIIRPLSATSNVSVNITTGALNFTEDSRASFLMNVQDEDFKIPAAQRTYYYNESLSINITIQGPNPRLFNFTLSQAPAVGSNLSIYGASFTPNKSDVGVYNISINVSDESGLSDTYNFNVSIAEVDHIPNITAMQNQTSLVNASLLLDMNATDAEDGSDNGNLTYTLSFLTGTDFITTNWSIFNNQTGVLNITFNDTQAGTYSINVTVVDLTSKQNSEILHLKVYGVPSFISPAENTLFNLTEAVNSNLSFRTNHSVGDNLNYSFYLNRSLIYNVTALANGSLVNWSFTPTLLQETYGVSQNLTLTISNLIYPQLNATRNFTMNISHTNAPVLFNSSIPSQQKNYDQAITVNLSSHFSDIDSLDSFYDQNISFIIVSNMSSNSTITVQATNGSMWNSSLILTFSATSAAHESFNVTATDGTYSNYSNTFTIEFTTPTQITSSATSSSGGGGSSQVRPVSLNIIVPGPLTARKQDRLVVPVAIVNTGKITLNDVVLRNAVAKNGLFREDLIASFDTSFFQSLKPGESQNLTLIVDINTREVGLYEVTLNGTSATPAFSDTSKLYINVEEGDTTAEKISFTQEFIAQNPQCIEIKEILDAARELYLAGEDVAAANKVDDALEACKAAISQASRAQTRERLYQSLTDNLGIATLIAVALGVGYYWIRRMMLQRSYSQPAAEQGKV